MRIFLAQMRQQHDHLHVHKTSRRRSVGIPMRVVVDDCVNLDELAQAS